MKLRALPAAFAHPPVLRVQGPPLSVPSLATMTRASNVIAAVAEAGVMAALERNCHKVRF